MSDDNKNLSEQSQRRLEKLQALQADGAQLYPNDFKPDAVAQLVRDEAGPIPERVEGEDPPTLPNAEKTYRLAGRLLAFRSFGKSTFGKINDRSGPMQIFAQKNVLGEESYAAFKKLDLGDIIGLEGTPFVTKTGELTLKLSSWRPLVKCLHPLPEKFHGLQDVDTRYRQRYLDLMTSPEVRDAFVKRAKIIEYIRRFFIDRDYLEVETPMMHPLVSGAAAEPFVTHHNSLHMDLYLRIAPELYLKRLVVGGFERVFEINRNFRNEGMSIQHNPEFTMIEFYQAYADYNDMMDLTEELLRGAAEEICGSSKFVYQETEIDFGPAFKRVPLADAVAETFKLTNEQLNDRDCLSGLCAKLGFESDKEGWSHAKCLVTLFEEKVEPTLIQPTFVTAFPTEVSPLARANDADPSVVDRFELYIYGREIANAFSELNDPFDQKARFEKQVEEKAKGDKETMDYDADYIAALEYGLAPTAGEGLGIDRLAMLLTNQASIRDVILFPQMRPKEG